MRINDYISTRGVLLSDISEKLGNPVIDTPMLSKIKNGLVVPTVEDAKKLCEILDCDILDMYDTEDIDYISLSRKVKKQGVAKEKACYKLTTRLPVEAKDKITKEVLNKCGYPNQRAWLWRCYERLMYQYDCIMKNEKKEGQ